ncbi:helix-turn-helix domain-containing protein [Streptomyces sp. NPDC054797]
MDAPQPTVIARASVRNPGETPRSGVVHVNARHTRRFTVVGNHLAQHPELSLTARGLALYIQSLPTGARIGIKDLAPQFPESEHRIAGALRELETYGYLRRTRERLPNGRMVTRTVSYNRPGCLPEDQAPTEPDSVPARVPAPAAAPSPPPSPLPEPRDPVDPFRRQVAAALLTELRRFDHRLLLGAEDIDRLAPAVEAWLERGARPESVLAVLTANPPPQIRNPAGLIAHRLTAQLPPPLEPVPRAPAFVPPDPFQTCQTCDLAFRAPAPGHCQSCHPDLKGTA